MGCRPEFDHSGRHFGLLCRNFLIARFSYRIETFDAECIFHRSGSSSVHLLCQRIGIIKQEKRMRTPQPVWR